MEKENVKILGITLSNDLTWDVHAKTMLQNLRFFFRSYARSCRRLNLDSRRLLYNAAIASRLNYCDLVWDGCSVEYVNKLQTVQNRCARRILDKLPGTSAGPLLRDLGWISLQDKRQLHKCVMLHRLIQGNGPNALQEQLRPYTIARYQNTRGAANNCLHIPSFNTNYAKKSFMYEATKIWNSLPSHLRQITNSKTFKEKLNVHFLMRDV